MLCSYVVIYLLRSASVSNHASCCCRLHSCDKTLALIRCGGALDTVPYFEPVFPLARTTILDFDCYYFAPVDGSFEIAIGSVRRARHVLCTVFRAYCKMVNPLFLSQSSVRSLRQTFCQQGLSKPLHTSELAGDAAISPCVVKFSTNSHQRSESRARWGTLIVGGRTRGDQWTQKNNRSAPAEASDRFKSTGTQRANLDWHGPQNESRKYAVVCSARFLTRSRQAHLPRETNDERTTEPCLKPWSMTRRFMPATNHRSV
jgi:hypothetical protein